MVHVAVQLMMQGASVVDAGAAWQILEVAHLVDKPLIRKLGTQRSVQVDVSVDDEELADLRLSMRNARDSVRRVRLIVYRLSYLLQQMENQARALSLAAYLPHKRMGCSVSEACRTGLCACRRSRSLNVRY